MLTSYKLIINEIKINYFKKLRMAAAAEDGAVHKSDPPPPLPDPDPSAARCSAPVREPFHFSATGDLQVESRKKRLRSGDGPYPP